MGGTIPRQTGLDCGGKPSEEARGRKQIRSIPFSSQLQFLYLDSLCPELSV